MTKFEFSTSNHSLSKAFTAAVARVVKAAHKAQDKLTEQQMAEAFKQAVVCGDFQRLVRVDGQAQSVIYLPYAREQELEAKIKELEAAALWALSNSGVYPERDQEVFVSHGSRQWITKAYWDGQHWRYCDGHEIIYRVTHWRHLPARPLT